MQLYLKSYLENIGYIKQKIQYTNLIAEQAITLFIPVSFLKNVIDRFNSCDKNVIRYTLNEITEQFKENQKAYSKINQIINNTNDWFKSFLNKYIK